MPNQYFFSSLLSHDIPLYVVKIQELKKFPALACVSLNQSDAGLSPERAASLYANQNHQ